MSAPALHERDERLDTAPLTGRIDPRELREFRRTLPPRRKGNLAAPIIGAIVMVAMLGFMLRFGFDVLDARGTHGLLFAPMLLPYIIIPLALGIVIARGLIRNSARRQFRIARFAAANGLEYRAYWDAPIMPGLIFGEGHDRSASDIVTRGQGTGPITDALSIGNHFYVTGSGKSRQEHRWGYVEIRLPTPLPNIVLDAKGNNSLFFSNLPVSLDRHQRLSLEGDFDRHFVLYCPQGYEQDALYLFTPDIMERFIDRSAELDVEIVDDRMYLYSMKELSTTDPDTWRWLFATAAALTERIGAWMRWRDSRLGETRALPAADGGVALVRPPAGVAAQGRRLKRSTGWVWIVIAGALFLFGAYNFVRDVFSSFFG